MGFTTDNKEGSDGTEKASDIFAGFCGVALTLSSGVPFVRTSQTAKTRIYATPHNGGKISLWNGSGWQLLDHPEISIKTTDSQTCALTNTSAVITAADASQLIAGMKVSGTGIAANTTISSISGNSVTLNNAATATGSNTITFKVPATTAFDIFEYISSGAPKMEFCLWSNTTTRATGYTLYNGVPCKTGDQTRRLIGSGCTTDVDGEIETSFGSLASGGGQARWLLANADITHQAQRNLFVGNTVDNYDYSTNAWRSANGSDTMRASWMVCIPGNGARAQYAGFASTDTDTISAILGVGYDSTTEKTGSVGLWQKASTAGHVSAMAEANPDVGLHFFQALERGAGSGVQTFYGDAGDTDRYQNGLHAQIWA